MKIEQGLNPNCSEYTLKIDMPVEETRKKKLMDLIDFFQTVWDDEKEQKAKEILEAEGIPGLFDTSFNGVVANDREIVINGYLNEEGLCEWLEKNGYQFELENDD